MSNELAVMTAGALTIEQLLEQRHRIEQAMQKAMKENMHFGKVQGCGDKPTLLQPGAQLLCTLFRLRPEYEVFQTDMERGHKSYRVTCRLYLMGTTPPVSIGEGVGEASSMESKHRYRNAAAEIEDTGDELPKTYWDIRNKQGDEHAKQWLASAYDGQHVGPKKIDGVWKVVIFKGGGEGKVENANPADVHNTVLKMAKKRAFVDATITATASNDLFTQDLEDIRANMDATDSTAPVTAKTKEKPASEAPGAKEEPKLKTWKDTVVHFGKTGGKIKGKKLGELPEDTLQWLFEKMGEKGDSDLSAADKKLKAAVIMWKAETSGKWGAPKSDAQAAPENEQHAANLETLASQLDMSGIDNETFFRVANVNKWTNAESFDEITAVTAEDLVEKIEIVLTECRKAQEAGK